MTQSVAEQLRKILMSDGIKRDSKLPLANRFPCENVKTKRDIETEKGEQTIRELKNKMNRIMNSVK